MSQKPVQIGLIGAGCIGSLHAGSLATRLQTAELAAVNPLVRRG